MSMSFRWAGIFMLSCFACLCPAKAQRSSNEGQRLIDATQIRLAKRGNIEVKVDVRSVGFEFVGPIQVASSYQSKNAAYHRVLLTWREPQDYRALYQSARFEENTLRVGSAGCVSRLGDQKARALEYDPVSKGTKPLEFGRLSDIASIPMNLGSDSADLVLARILASREGHDFTLRREQETMIVGEESWGGRTLVRIDTPSWRGVFSIWVDREQGLIRRTLRAEGIPTHNMGPSRPRVIETLYTYKFDQPIRDEELDPFRSLRNFVLLEMGNRDFGPHSELVAWLKSASSQGAGRGALRPLQPPAAHEPSPSDATATGTPAVSPPEIQQLDASQMAAIVLIESDDGMGTGFVTEIRGLPFVVTNLHVIGGVANPRITTLNGVKVKTGAVHGAVGRDLAILKIEGEAPAARLKLSEDPLRTAKIGDKVVVVGNRRGGGVATQVSGVVRGLGPDKIEVDAAFQPGNSGSPIIHVESGEVIGLAAYSQMRELDLSDGPSASVGTGRKAEEPKVEQRWFGFRTDGVAAWEAIEQARWREQAARVEAFRAETEAIYNAMRARFADARVSPAVARVIERYEEKTKRAGGEQVQMAQEVGEFFRGLRTVAENGKRELREGRFYDYFQSSLYWESSIPQQIKTREQLANYLDRASENSAAFLSRLRRQ